MHLTPKGMFRTLEHFAGRNLLLMLILAAISLAIFAPMPQDVFTEFDVNALLVALIFISQGIKIDMSHAGKIGKYLKIIGVGALVAVVAYPLLAMALADLFELTSDNKVGFLLMVSFPVSLEAGMAMAASAGGDPLTAVILLTSLNIIGLASIPLNLGIWLGRESPVSEWDVMQNLVLYLFLPIFAGQMLRKFLPKLPHQLRHVNHYLPMFCITGLVYMSCSRESALFRELRLSDFLHIIGPSLILHLSMFGLAWLVATRLIKLEERQKRSFVIITSEKPMSLSVALWSMTYAHHHPLAIFPILVFYVGQIVVDSFFVTRMVAHDSPDLCAEDSDEHAC